MRVIYKNIGDIKDTMIQMLQSMNKLGRPRDKSTDKFALMNIESIKEHLPLEEHLSPSSAPLNMKKAPSGKALITCIYINFLI